MRKYFYLFFVLFTCCNSLAQTKEELIIGEWVEVKREKRNGPLQYIETRHTFSFYPNGKGKLSYMTEQPDKIKEYYFKDDLLIFDRRIFDILSISKDTAKFIWRLTENPQDHDVKIILIRKSKFDALTNKQISYLMGSVEKSELDKLEPPDIQEIISRPEKVDDVYEFTDELATFPGGQEKYYEFVRENLKWPNDANVQGNIYLSFIVEKDGSISNIKILKGLAEDFNAEAIRVIKMMPNWNPGKQNGNPVRTRITVPVKFKSE